MRMALWPLEAKAAASLVLMLLGLGYLTGVANIAFSVGLSPKEIKARYSPAEKPKSVEELLSQAPAVDRKKLVHVIHAHFIPYTLIFAILCFFVIHFSWRVELKIFFLGAAAISIPLDFLGMIGARFLDPGFYILIMASGFVFGTSVGLTIIFSFYELWFTNHR